MSSAIQELLPTAIREKRLIRFVFNGSERIAEPHDHGMLKGTERLLAYQLKPRPGWRLFTVSEMSDPALLEQTFRGSRHSPTGKHHNWDRVFARVEPAG